MKVVFIAGPFRGKDSWEMENNIRRAEALALEVWRLGGFAVLCPHTNTRFFQGAAPDKVWLEGDHELLKRCDAVLFTPDWERSEGAKKERSVAIEADIPIFYEIRDLIHWRILNTPEKCPGCRNEIDPDVCHCGESIKGHTAEHNPVPVGCTCGYADQSNLHAHGPAITHDRADVPCPGCSAPVGQDVAKCSGCGYAE